jgi:aspartyl-tRNA(Asn)/glutamyl-tRNA(Gln) amidotransferase subunit A
MARALPRLAELAQALCDKRVTSTQLVEECLGRIADATGQGDSSVVRVYQETALAAAAQIDARRSKGEPLSALAGIPISIKDNIDQQGETTLAGSLAARSEPPARYDAPILKRLRAAGAIPIARTNMVEFAYSGLGLNRRLGTPTNPVARGRIPGGSSSGAATALRHGFCSASVGTDTAGSVRVPAAFCGLTAFKPTQGSLPTDGIFPLSPSYDSPGAIGVSVDCCARLHAAMAGATAAAPASPATGPLRLGVLAPLPQPPMDSHVDHAFIRALSLLRAHDLDHREIPWPVGEAIDAIDRSGGIVDREAALVHQALFATRRTEYDRHVAPRIEKGQRVTDAEHQLALQQRALVVARFAELFAAFDAILLPTVPIVPPKLREIGSDEDYNRLNRTVLSLTRIANIADLCAVSLPCHAPGELPVGLMLMGAHGADQALLSIAARVEVALGGVTRRPTLRAA